MAKSCKMSMPEALAILGIKDGLAGRVELHQIAEAQRLAFVPNTGRNADTYPYVYNAEQIAMVAQIRRSKGAKPDPRPNPRPKFPEEVPGCIDPVIWGHIVGLTLRIEALEAALIARGITIPTIPEGVPHV